jgi:hypothetical protein
MCQWIGPYGEYRMYPFLSLGAMISDFHIITDLTMANNPEGYLPESRRSFLINLVPAVMEFRRMDISRKRKQYFRHYLLPSARGGSAKISGNPPLPKTTLHRLSYGSDCKKREQFRELLL